jgi:hypothetical protein
MFIVQSALPWRGLSQPLPRFRIAAYGLEARIKAAHDGVG